MWSWGINGCSLDSVLGCGLDGIIGYDGWDWFKWIPQMGSVCSEEIGRCGPVGITTHILEANRGCGPVGVFWRGTVDVVQCVLEGNSGCGPVGVF